MEGTNRVFVACVATTSDTENSVLRFLDKGHIPSHRVLLTCRDLSEQTLRTPSGSFPLIPLSELLEYIKEEKILLVIILDYGTLLHELLFLKNKNQENTKKFFKTVMATVIACERWSVPLALNEHTALLLLKHLFSCEKLETLKLEKELDVKEGKKGSHLLDRVKSAVNLSGPTKQKDDLRSSKEARKDPEKTSSRIKKETKLHQKLFQKEKKKQQPTSELLHTQVETEKMLKFLEEKNLQFLQIHFVEESEKYLYIPTKTRDTCRYRRVGQSKVELVWGNMRQLVEYLLLPETAPLRQIWDHKNFVDSFFIAYEDFTTPAELFEKIISFYGSDKEPMKIEPIEPTGSEPLVPRFTPGTQQRVLWVIRKWIEFDMRFNGGEVWRNDMKLYQLFSEFYNIISVQDRREITVVTNLEKSNSDKRKRALSKVEKKFGEEVVAPVEDNPSLVCLQSSTEKRNQKKEEHTDNSPGKVDSLLQIRVIEMAKQLSLMLMVAVQQVRSIEIYRSIGRDMVPTVAKVWDFTEKIGGWIAAEILQEKDKATIYKKVIYFILVAEEAKKIHNYHLMAEIIKSLDRPCLKPILPEKAELLKYATEDYHDEGPDQIQKGKGKRNIWDIWQELKLCALNPEDLWLYTCKILEEEPDMPTLPSLDYVFKNLPEILKEDLEKVEEKPNINDVILWLEKEKIGLHVYLLLKRSRNDPGIIPNKSIQEYFHKAQKWFDSEILEAICTLRKTSRIEEHRPKSWFYTRTMNEAYLSGRLTTGLEGGDRLTFQPNEVILKKGQEISTLFYIVSGRVHRQMLRKDKKPLIEIIEKNRFLGLTTLLGQKYWQRMDTTVAVEETVLYPIKLETVLDQCAQGREGRKMTEALFSQLAESLALRFESLVTPNNAHLLSPAKDTEPSLNDKEVHEFNNFFPEVSEHPLRHFIIAGNFSKLWTTKTYMCLVGPSKEKKKDKATKDEINKKIIQLNWIQQVIHEKNKLIVEYNDTRKNVKITIKTNDNILLGHLTNITRTERGTSPFQAFAQKVLNSPRKERRSQVCPPKFLETPELTEKDETPLSERFSHDYWEPLLYRSPSGDSLLSSLSSSDLPNTPRQDTEKEIPEQDRTALSEKLASLKLELTPEDWKKILKGAPKKVFLTKGIPDSNVYIEECLKNIREQRRNMADIGQLTTQIWEKIVEDSQKEGFLVRDEAEGGGQSHLIREQDSTGVAMFQLIWGTCLIEQDNKEIERISARLDSAVIDAMDGLRPRTYIRQNSAAEDTPEPLSSRTSRFVDSPMKGASVLMEWPRQENLYGVTSLLIDGPAACSIRAISPSTTVRFIQGYWLNILFEYYPEIAPKFYYFLSTLLLERITVYAASQDQKKKKTQKDTKHDPKPTSAPSARRRADGGNNVSPRNRSNFQIPIDPLREVSPRDKKFKFSPKTDEKASNKQSFLDMQPGTIVYHLFTGLRDPSPASPPNSRRKSITKTTPNSQLQPKSSTTPPLTDSGGKQKWRGNPGILVVSDPDEGDGRRDSGRDGGHSGGRDGGHSGDRQESVRDGQREGGRDGRREDGRYPDGGNHNEGRGGSLAGSRSAFDSSRDGPEGSQGVLGDLDDVLGSLDYRGPDGGNGGDDEEYGDDILDEVIDEINEVLEGVLDGDSDGSRDGGL